MRIIEPADYRDQPWRGSSPWGQVQRAAELAPGLHQVSTAGHGGLWLSPDRVEHLKALFPGWLPFAGWPWLEEDCDASLAALGWPELFPARAVRSAVHTARQCAAWEHCRANWLKVALRLPPDAMRIAAAEEERLRAGEIWERGSMSSGMFRAPYGDCWAVSFRRTIDGATTTRLMPYPDRCEWTLRELEEYPEYDPDLHDLTRSELEARRAGKAVQS